MINPSKAKGQDQTKEISDPMASAPGSSSRPHGPLPGVWASCLVSHPQLSNLQTQGYLPAADLVSVRSGLTSVDGKAFAENFPTPSKEERECFVPFLLRGLGFPIHPFLRGLLEFYGIQLHHMSCETTASSGAMSPFWSGEGMGMLHKERRSATQHDRYHTGSFTQVRAAVRRKTLLLLWWIDVENAGECGALARQGCLGTRVTTRV